MPASPPFVSVCSTCGRALNGNGDCLACLMQIGFDESTVERAKSLGYGDFEIAEREDGSPWELGRGAMGVTYRAVDKVLHRSVALKVIDVPSAPGGAHGMRERFLREARAAAALRHPNVASVFHFGASPEVDRCYYAMELVEGETLEARVRRDGPLPLELALDVGVQVTRALIAAAAQNLIHRDLKPANIMLSPNEAEEEKLEAKVIDFGLAKLTAAAAEKDLTQGGFVGTPAFASPEQFGGEPADARSDIYSLGVTLWYALTGELPFSGRAIEEIRHAQKQLPLPIAQLLARKLPKPVVALLQRALAIDPAERPPSARALLAELESCRARLSLPHAFSLSQPWQKWTTLAAALAIFGLTFFLSQSRREKQESQVPSSAEESIAVLPFDNRSTEKANAFFAEGFQDDLLTSLVKLGELKVIGRSSVMSYRDATRRNLREIGRQLGVSHVLEGDVQRVADRVLIHVNLTNTRDGRAVWAERYDRPLTDATGLQNELATQIATALRARLTPEDKARLSKRPTNNPEAYVLYLQGLAHERASVSQDDFIAADRLYTEAIALDPGFALAHARASIVNSLMYHFSNDFSHTPALKARARTEAAEALRLAPTMGEAHQALGDYFYRGERDYTAALEELSLARKALPNDSQVLQMSAWIYRRQNRWRDALATLERAQDLDPRTALYDLPKTFLMVRDWAGAEQAARRLLQIEPDSGFGLSVLAWLEIYRKRDPAAARALLEKIPTNVPAVTRDKWDLCLLQRDFDAADKVLAGYPPEELAGEPKSFYAACTALVRGDTRSAQRLFAETLPFCEAQVRNDPEVASRHAQLGWVYAYLGRKGEALREGNRAVELIPENKDALDGPALAANLAQIYARTGRATEAISLIERLLVTPAATLGNITLADLRLRWEWDPLRSDPRFQKILAGPEPKTIY